MSQTLKVTISVSPEAHDALSERLFSAGAGGIEERPFDLILYTDKEEEAAHFKEVAEAWSSEQKDAYARIESISIEAISDDWKTRWYEALEPVQLTRRFTIVPQKDEPRGRRASPPKDEILYRPEAAFGSGSHATTQLMAQFLEDLSPSIHPEASFLDVGTGNGVLLLLLLALGHDHLLGCDISEIAVQSARHNLRLNGYFDLDSTPPTQAGTPAQVRGARILLGSAAQFRRGFDCVLANIESYILEEMKAELVERVSPGGWLLLSGILKEDQRALRRSFEELGLQTKEARELGDWSALLLTRPRAR